MFKQCGAQIAQAHNKHTGTWGGFEISFTEYVKEISIITRPSHRRRDKNSQIRPLELSVMFATFAGTSVAVDGTNTSSCSGHDL